MKRPECEACADRRGDRCVSVPVAMAVGSVRIAEALAFCRLRFFRMEIVDHGYKTKRRRSDHR